MVKPILVRQPTPELLKQEMTDVIAEFYNLDKILNDTNQHTQNYVVIRLVTVIEQFFRKIVEKKINDDKLGNYVPNQLKLDKRTFMNLKSITKATLISSSYSFQSVSEIKEIAKQFGVQNPFSNSSSIEKEFETLFQFRHNTVHSVVSSYLEIKKYYQITEDLIKNILHQVYDQESIFATFKGNALAKLNRYEEAIRCYDEGLRLEPKNGRVFALKGFSLASMNRHEEAIRYYDKGLKLDPVYVYAYSNKGYSLTLLGRHEEAIKCHDDGLKLDPDYAYAYINKGLSFAWVGKHKEAIQCFDRSIALDPKVSNGCTCKGISLYRLGMFENAIKCFDEALNLNPMDSYAYVGKGLSLIELGRNEDSLTCFNEDIKRNPNSGYAYAGKILSLSELGRNEELEECTRQLRKIDSTIGV